MTPTLMNGCLVVESSGEERWSEQLRSLSDEQHEALVARISEWQQRVAVAVK